MGACDALDENCGGLRFQGPPVEYPRTVWQRMLPFDLASFDGQTQCSWSYAQMSRRLGEIHPPVGARLVVR